MELATVNANNFVKLYKFAAYCRSERLRDFRVKYCEIYLKEIEKDATRSIGIRPKNLMFHMFSAISRFNSKKYYNKLKADPLLI